MSILESRFSAIIIQQRSIGDILPNFTVRTGCHKILRELKMRNYSKLFPRNLTFLVVPGSQFHNYVAFSISFQTSKVSVVRSTYPQTIYREETSAN